MNDKIMGWYLNKKYPHRKIVVAGKKKGIPAPFVHQAMEDCYHKIQRGKNISDIEIGRYVLNTAKDLYSKNDDIGGVDMGDYDLRMRGRIYPAYAIIFLWILISLVNKIWW